MSVLLTIFGTIAGSATYGVAHGIKNSVVRNITANALGTVSQNLIKEGYNAVTKKDKKKK